jgi:hypothetical protein
MLDTQTGRLWTVTCVADPAAADPKRCVYTRLDPVLYDDEGSVTPGSPTARVPRKP